MAWYAYDSFDPISISAVPAGWRALYSSSTTKKGFEVVPLVGWAVFRVSVRGSLSGAEEVLQSGNVIEGAVVSPGNGPVVCALAVDGFIGYLSPDQEDPDTIAPEVGRRPLRLPGHAFNPAGAPAG